MDLKSYKDRIGRLSALVEGWHSAEDIPTLERDMVLDELRKLYEELRFSGTPRHEPATIDEPADVHSAYEDVADEDLMPVAIDLSEVLALGVVPDEELQPEAEAESAEAEPVAAPVVESAPAPEPIPEPVEESAAESEPSTEPEPQRPTMQTLFGIEEETRTRHRHKQRVIMSLYNSAPRPAAKPQPAVPEPEEPAFEELTVEVAPAEPRTKPASGPATEPDVPAPDPEPTTSAEEDDVEITEITIDTSATKRVLGDVINQDVKTLADTITPPADVASELRRQEPVDDLRKALDINDKFLLVRDLFDGDADACDRMLETLSGCATLDDCILHIAENYVWNPNSDGATLLMGLLERKYA